MVDYSKIKNNPEDSQEWPKHVGDHKTTEIYLQNLSALLAFNTFYASN